MIRAALAAFVVAIAFAAALALSGCALFKSPVVKDVMIEVADAACVEAATSLELPELAKACPNIAEDILRRLLSAKRSAVRAGMCREPISSLTPASTLYVATLRMCMNEWGYRNVYSPETLQ